MELSQQENGYTKFLLTEYKKNTNCTRKKELLEKTKVKEKVKDVSVILLEKYNARKEPLTHQNVELTWLKKITLELNHQISIKHT